METDIDNLRADNPLPDVALSFGVSLEKDGHEFEACCPFHEENTPSFTLFVGQDGAWRYHCFGCGERGDVLDFVQKIKGCDFKEALKILGGEVRRDNIAPRSAAQARDVYAGIEPLEPEKELAAGKRVKLWNPKRERFGTITPSMVFPYRSRSGAITGYVLRHDLKDGGKETPMVMWCRLTSGETEWCRYPFPKPRPLFGLERIDDGKQVIIAEGEKCATVGSAVTGRCFMSWAGGTYGVNHADWSPLTGRSVVIWPDADAPGLATAHEIAARLLALGCTVKIIDVSDKPKGWDVADAADEGWTREEIDTFMRSRVRVFTGKQEGGGQSENADSKGNGGSPSPDVTPPVSADAGGGERTVTAAEIIPPYADHVEGQHDPDADWMPDPYGEFGEIEIDNSTDLVEIDTASRRPVPASGRTKPGVPFRVWGGDIDALREWVFLSADGVFCHAHTGERMGKTAFDLVMTNITPMVEIINKKADNENKKFPPSKCLVEFCDGIVCSKTMYRPDVDDMTAWIDGIMHLNSYLPATVPAADPNWEQHDAWRAARDHIHNIIPDGADALIKWMAHNVQFPGKKILWAPIIVGQFGDGKTTTASILQMAMGRANVSSVGTEELFSDYTSWREGRCVRILEELHHDGSSKSSLVEKLKEPVTNAEVSVVGKGEKGRSVVNVTNYIGLTNNDDALRIPEGDRRFGVWKTRFKDRKHAVSELNKDYWRRLNKAVNGHPEVLRGWLMSVDLSDFDPTDAPEETAAKRTMIETTRSAPEADTREALALGGFGVGPDVIATDCLGDIMKGMGLRMAGTTALSKIFIKIGWSKIDSPVKWRGKPRRVYYKPGDWSNVEPETLIELIRRKLDDTEQSEIQSGYW